MEIFFIEMIGNSCNVKSLIFFILMLIYVLVVEVFLYKNLY